MINLSLSELANPKVAAAAIAFIETLHEIATGAAVFTHEELSAAPLVVPSAPSTVGALPSSIAPEAPPDFSTGALVPPVPAAPPAPLAAAPAGTPPAATVDVAGLPHDARIHASTKRVNADGTWTKKKGLDAAMIAAVEAELRAVMGAPATVAPPPAAVVPPAPAGVMPGWTPPVVAPVAPAPAPVAPPMPPAPVVVTQDFPGVVLRLSQASLSLEQQSEILGKLGLTTWGQLAHRPELAATALQWIDYVAAQPK